MGWTELHNAASNGNTESVRQLLLQAGTEVDCRNTIGRTPLMVAARHGNLAAVKLLLEAGAGVNLKTGYGWMDEVNFRADAGGSALHMAVCSCENSAAIIELLLQAGAEVDSRDTIGRTPLMLASYHGNLVVVKLLLEVGADPYARDIKGKTALDRANAEGRGEVSRSLKKAIDDKKVAEDPAEQQQLVSLLTRFASLRESRST